MTNGQKLYPQKIFVEAVVHYRRKFLVDKIFKGQKLKCVLELLNPYSTLVRLQQ